MRISTSKRIAVAAAALGMTAGSLSISVRAEAVTPNCGAYCVSLYRTIESQSADLAVRDTGVFAGQEVIFKSATGDSTEDWLPGVTALVSDFYQIGLATDDVVFSYGDDTASEFQYASQWG